MTDAELENEVMSLRTSEIKHRIDDMHEFMNDPSWSWQAKLGAEQYLPVLQLELTKRGESYRADD